jgi:CheY-like chemotaxis protein
MRCSIRLSSFIIKSEDAKKFLMLSNLPKHTVLLVDDELLNVKLLSSILKGTYNLLTASNGKEALSILAQLHKADQIEHLLILLDVRMPEMDGLTALAEIRQNYPHVPVLMCTAVNAYEDVVQAGTLGAVDYILKPFRVQMVRQKVERAAALHPEQIARQGRERQLTLE